METIGQAIEMIMAEAKKEYGEDFKLEEGDTITGVFNDGTVQLSFENGQMGIEVLVGAPYKFDFNLGFTE